MTWASLVHEANRRPPSPPAGHGYHHTCFLYSPSVVSTNSPPLIAYISRNGGVQTMVIDLDWTKNPRIAITELISSQRMSQSDFKEILRLAGQECAQGNAENAPTKYSNVSQRLREFQPAFDLQFFARQMSDIYIVTLRSGLEDGLWEADPPEYNPTSFPSSCNLQ